VELWDLGLTTRIPGHQSSTQHSEGPHWPGQMQNQSPLLRVGNVRWSRSHT
jgi:hypothetical protein